MTTGDDWNFDPENDPHNALVYMALVLIGVALFALGYCGGMHHDRHEPKAPAELEAPGRPLLIPEHEPE